MYPSLATALQQPNQISIRTPQRLPTNPGDLQVLFPLALRIEIINYLVDANWRHINEYPDELNTADMFKTKIISQSVIANPELPLFYSKYMLHKLNFRHIPQGILICNNVRVNLTFRLKVDRNWSHFWSLRGRSGSGI